MSNAVTLLSLENAVFPLLVEIMERFPLSQEGAEQQLVNALQVGSVINCICRQVDVQLLEEDDDDY